MALFNLIARLGLNTSGFEVGIKRAESLSTRFSKNVSSSVKGQFAAAFGTAAIIAATKSVVDYAGKIQDLSARLGVSTTALQEFDYAAQQNGASLDDFVGALQKLAVARSKALKDPSGDIVEDFKRLGVSIDDLRNKRLEDLVRQIGGAFKDAKNPQQLMAAGIATMGKSATTLFPAMREGLDELAVAAHAVGTVIEEETTAKLDQLGDRINELKLQTRGLVAEYAGGFVTALKTVAEFGEYAAARIGAAAGALAGGASIRDAAAAAAEAGGAVLEKNLERQQASAAARQKRKKAAGESFSVDEESDSKKDKKKSDLRFFESNLNELQSIGALSRSNPALTEQKRANQFLKKIETHTKKASEKSSSEWGWA